MVDERIEIHAYIDTDDDMKVASVEEQILLDDG